MPYLDSVRCEDLHCVVSYCKTACKGLSLSPVGAYSPSNAGDAIYGDILSDGAQTSQLFWMWTGDLQRSLKRREADLQPDRVCKIIELQIQMSDKHFVLDPGTAPHQLQRIGQLAAAPFGLR